MLKIRLMRIGSRKRPFYRVVAVDERAKRTGGFIENLGTYNPLTEPKEIKLNQERIDYWIKKGGQLSVGFLRIIGKAPQRNPRKPKKEKKESSVISPRAAGIASGDARQPSDENKPENSERPKETPEPTDSSETPTPSDTPSPSESSEKKGAK